MASINIKPVCIELGIRHTVFTRALCLLHLFT